MLLYTVALSLTACATQPKQLPVVQEQTQEPQAQEQQTLAADSEEDCYSCIKVTEEEFDATQAEIASNNINEHFDEMDRYFDLMTAGKVSENDLKKCEAARDASLAYIRKNSNSPDQIKRLVARVIFMQLKDTEPCPSKQRYKILGYDAFWKHAR